MKTLGVRVSELEQKRLTDLAIKRGGTVSDTVREIIGKYFESDSKAKDEKAEHEKTRAKFSDLDNALASQAEDIQAVKAGLGQLGKLLGQYITATTGGNK